MKQGCSIAPLIERYFTERLMRQRVLAIPSKRHDKRQVHFLTRPEIEALLAAPDRTTWFGRRDHTLLLLAVQHASRPIERRQHPRAPDQTCAHGQRTMSLIGVQARVAACAEAQRGDGIAASTGIDCSVIALWLGRETVEITQTYLHAHLALKEAALTKLAPYRSDKPVRSRARDRLLAFLEELSGPKYAELNLTKNRKTNHGHGQTEDCVHFHSA